MSSRKGDVRKKGQKYQNSTGFKNNLHDTSRMTKMINNTAVVGVCARCKEAIEWRKKFKKYKPLKAPKKCVKCGEKTIKHAYHTYCTKCAQQGGFCEKCGEAKEIVAKPEPSEQEKAAQESSLQQELKMLTERQRRTFFRHVEKGDLQMEDNRPERTADISDDNDGNAAIDDDDDYDDEMCEETNSDKIKPSES